MQDFRQNGYQKVQLQNVASFVAQSKESCGKQFMCDERLPDVLVFPPGTDLHNHPFYVSGHILLQGKASCLPAHVLAPPTETHVVDAYAPPGNKSSHLASLMNNKGYDLTSVISTLLKKTLSKTQTNKQTNKKTPSSPPKKKMLWKAGQLASTKGPMAQELCTVCSKHKMIHFDVS